jgi:hypothetical protein
MSITCSNAKRLAFYIRDNAYKAYHLRLLICILSSIDFWSRLSYNINATKRNKRIQTLLKAFGFIIIASAV